MNLEKEMCQPAKESVAQQILALAERITCLADDTAMRTDDKLSPIMAQAMPAPECVEENRSQYPPLFDNLRGMLENTRESLSRINDFIDRTEL